MGRMGASTVIFSQGKGTRGILGRGRYLHELFDQLGRSITTHCIARHWAARFATRNGRQ